MEIKLDEAAPTLPEREQKTKILRLKEIFKNKSDYATISTFQKFQKEYKILEDLLSRVDHKGPDLEKEYDALNERLVRIVEETESKNDNIRQTMEFVVGQIGKIKELIAPLLQQELPARKVLEEWIDLSIQEKIFESMVMASIKVSYEHLESPTMRICLLFCSIFPENSVIKKRPLIYWWIGEGLISSEGDKSADEVGEYVFQALTRHGLLVPHKPNPYVNACKIHPWTRHMLISKAKEAELFHFDSLWTPSYDISKSRRACLHLDDRYCINSDIIKEENLLSTVFNVNEQYLNFVPDRLSKLKKLVVLQLGRWQNSVEHHIEVKDGTFLKGLGTQKHLKYLSLRGISLIPEILPCISGLISLEILDLRACHNLENLPAEIVSLKKLTNLDASECYLLESMPKGLENLPHLQVLKGFVQGRSRRHCRLRDLANLRKLRKLSVYIGSGAEVQKEDFEKLEKFETLLCLTISWGLRSSISREDPNRPRKEKDEKPVGEELGTINSFSSPPKLEKLDLRGLPQERTENWLKPEKLKNLKKLYIRGGAVKSLVMERRNKWFVETLRLKYLENLEIALSKLKVGFPELKYLEMKRVKCLDIDQSENDKGIMLNADGIEKKVRLRQATTSNEGGEGRRNTLAA